MAEFADKPALEVDYNADDLVTCPGQLFALISVVHSDGKQKIQGADSKLAVKLRGVFPTKEEAAKHVDKIIKAEGAVFDVYLCDMNRWLLLPPPGPDQIDTEYSDKYLSDLFTGYKENQQAAKVAFDDRKRQVIQEGLESALLPDERIHPAERAAEASEPVPELVSEASGSGA